MAAAERLTGPAWRVLLCGLAAACATSGGDDDDDGRDGGGPPGDGGTEECSTGYDEDGDHLVDCFDPDCASLPECRPVERCTNLADDDADSLIDCADPDCADDPTCARPPETLCTDELDDDQDGLVDCEDDDCDAHPACGPAPGGDCEAVCDRQRECGAENPDCMEACECSNERQLALAFSESFYACIAQASCAIFDDSTPCFDQAEFSSTALAEDLVAECERRADCEGIPCEYFGMFGDDALEDLQACLERGGCLACLEEAATVCPPI
jgi:hypothetical protein